jgi:hypothetical protein
VAADKDLTDPDRHSVSVSVSSCQSVAPAYNPLSVSWEEAGDGLLRGRQDAVRLWKDYVKSVPPMTISTGRLVLIEDWSRQGDYYSARGLE